MKYRITLKNGSKTIFISLAGRKKPTDQKQAEKKADELNAIRIEEIGAAPDDLQHRAQKDKTGKWNWVHIPLASF